MNPIALRLHEAAVTLEGSNMPEIVAMLEIAEREILRLDDENIDPNTGTTWKTIAAHWVARCDVMTARLDDAKKNVVLQLFDRMRAWWMRRRVKSIVIIEYSGQATHRPQVHVSIYGNRASQTVYTWGADDQGNACASMYGRGLAEIFNVPICDRRDPQWPRTK